MVIDVVVFEGNYVDYSVEDGVWDFGIGWEIDVYNDIFGVDVCGSLLEGFFLNGDEEGGGGVLVIICGCFDICDDILGWLEVDVRGCVEFFVVFVFVGIIVDGNGV